MSEVARNEAGQFTPPPEPLFGKEGIERDAGYVPYVDETAVTEESLAELTVEDAVEARRAEAGTAEADIVTYSPLRDLPANVTLTIEQAAEARTARRLQAEDNRAKSVSSDFAEAIDARRAEAVNGDPRVAEHLGLDEGKPADVQNIAEPIFKTDEPSASNADGEIDPVLRQQIETHPQVREFLAAERESAITETRQAQQAYTAGLENLRAHNLAALAEVVPHLAGLAPAQFEQGLALLSQVDPPAFQTAMNILGRQHATVQALHQAQQQDQQQRAHAAQQQFETYSKAEDAKFRAMIGEKTPAETAEFGAEMVEYASELGIGRDQLVQLLQTEPIMRHSAFQKMIHDATQYRLQQKASRKATGAVPRSLPPVQRPGVAPPRGAAVENSSRIAGLQRQLASASGDRAIKLATELRRAKQSGRRD